MIIFSVKDICIPWKDKECVAWQKERSILW